ncbi:MAG: phosphoenolpyruvate--protein phosphotransferase, partial [Lachnospiraceae bacterium]|nr:phosphoenolpyruvate--protein phosphotransferase [Lachnospiraceae bacterium]
EAILRLIELTVQNAHKNKIPVAICGELAADSALTSYFLKIGVDELSVPVSAILSLRKWIRSQD